MEKLTKVGLTIFAEYRESRSVSTVQLTALHTTFLPLFPIHPHTQFVFAAGSLRGVVSVSFRLIDLRHVTEAI